MIKNIMTLLLLYRFYLYFSGKKKRNSPFVGQFSDEKRQYLISKILEKAREWKEKQTKSKLNQDLENRFILLGIGNKQCFEYM